jgi:hypothetical protein
MYVTSQKKGIKVQRYITYLYSDTLQVYCNSTSNIVNTNTTHKLCMFIFYFVLRVSVIQIDHHQVENTGTKGKVLQ